jgi:hypothetical protein
VSQIFVPSSASLQQQEKKENTLSFFALPVFGISAFFCAKNEQGPQLVTASGDLNARHRFGFLH